MSDNRDVFVERARILADLISRRGVGGLEHDTALRIMVKAYAVDTCSNVHCAATKHEGCTEFISTQVFDQNNP